MPASFEDFSNSFQAQGSQGSKGLGVKGLGESFDATKKGANDAQPQ